VKHVAILCGGKGTRLGYDGQKCLIETAGRPFLCWKLDQLADRGAEHFHLLVSYLAEEVRWVVRDDWHGIPVTYHYDIGANPIHAHHTANLPYFHWLTYGDSILDAPLVRRPFPYRYTNDEFLEDAGLMWCFGKSRLFVPRYTRETAWHVNTPDDWKKARANLH
jgi:hypothetical protein